MKMTNKQRRQVRAYERAMEALRKAQGGFVPEGYGYSYSSVEWTDRCQAQLEYAERNKTDFKHLLVNQ